MLTPRIVAPHHMTPRPIVFIGPSMTPSDARSICDADFRPPCRRGDLDALSGQAPIGLIDGVFHQDRAVSPGELTRALKRGHVIYGSSSMGALRAAEVRGMRGVGSIYTWYAQELILSDDEVALVFDPDTHRPLTVPLVNVRHATERLSRSGTLGDVASRRIVNAAQELHYTERTYPRILREAGYDAAAIQELLPLLDMYDLKRDDARLLLETLAREAHIHSRAPASHGTREVHEQPDRPASIFRGAGASAPVHIWESGDKVSWARLVLFLKLTGKFDEFCRRATDIATSQANGRMSPTLPDDTMALFSRWGWKTPEETCVTLADLGLTLATMVRHLNIKAGRRKPDRIPLGQEHFDVALRCELVLDDMRLKREALRCASFDTLAEDQPIEVREPNEEPTEEPTEDEQRWLCDLHGVPTWADLRTRLNQLDVDDAQLAEFVAQSRSVRLRTRPARRSTLLPSAGSFADVDGAFGLQRSPKPPGEARFAVPMAQALEHTARLRSVVGITRVGLIDALTDLKGVHISQVARPTTDWSSSYGSGKGDTQDGAIVGGIMEEIEKWAQERFAAPQVVRSFEDLRRTANALDPSLLDLPHDSIYEPALEIAWTSCLDLIQGQPIYVPTSAVALRRCVPVNDIAYSRRGARSTFSTNGLASGYTKAEALVHATCEYIERHASTMAHLKIDNPGLRREKGWPPRLDVSTLAARAARLARLVDHDDIHKVDVWDITSDVRVPTCLARIMTEDGPAIGYATHPRRAVAAVMALHEACQTAASTIAGGREDMSVKARSLGRHERPMPFMISGRKRWLTDEEHGHAGDFLVPDHEADDLYDEFSWIRQRLIEAGVRHLIAFDLTRSDLSPIHVVRVVIPGLETNNPFYCGPHARAALATDVLYARE